MRKKIKLCGAILATALASCTFALFGNTVLASDTYNLSKSAEELCKELPDSIDLSQSEYFPEVGDQGSTGSCWHFGTIYACLTYTNNKARGIKTTPENTLSPLFGYNYAAGTKNASLDDLIMQIGYPTVGILPIDTKNTISLYPRAEVWESAQRNRSGKYISYNVFGDEDNIVTGPDDASLYILKKTLSEGNLAAISSYSYNWNLSEVASGEHKGEVAIDRCDLNKTGGHIIALVGYDDNIWVDINHDGKQQQAELGAFKMVNSWGKDWANDGFVWVTYDCLNEKSQVITDADATRINNAIAAGTIKANKVNNGVRRSFFMLKTFSNAVVRDRISSECFLYMTVNTGSRKEMEVVITAISKKDGSEVTYTMPNMSGDTKNVAWDGTAYSTDGTMVLDLDNVISDITPETMEDYTWKVTFGDTKLDQYAVTVKDVHFKINGVKEYITSVSKIPLNGTKKTYDMRVRRLSHSIDTDIIEENKTNIIIYYGNSSYKEAYIHYRVGDGKWTTAPGVQMCVDDKQEGYKWKFVVNLDGSDTFTACFNDGNGKWDNNNSKDYKIGGTGGCYGIKDGDIELLREITEEEEVIFKLDKSEVTLYVGDEEKVNVIDVWPIPNDGHWTKWTSSDTSVATVEHGVVTGIKAGKATITACLYEGYEVTVDVTVKAREVKELTGATTASQTTVTSGDTITFTTTATGGTGSYKYSLIVHNKTTNKWSRITNNSASNEYTWEAGSAGKRIFYVDVTDESGKTVRTSGITVTTTSKDIIVTSNASVTHVAVGETVELTATATGGTGSYKYSYIVYNKTTGKWARIKDKITSNTYTWKAGSAGTRVFYIDVTDASGKTVRTKGITVVTEKSNNLNVTGTASVKSLSVGEKTVITASASGGADSYTYSYVVKNMATGEWYRFSFRNSKTLTWEATSKGTRLFYVEAKDSKGNVVRSEGITITVK